MARRLSHNRGAERWRLVACESDVRRSYRKLEPTFSRTDRPRLLRHIEAAPY